MYKATFSSKYSNYNYSIMLLKQTNVLTSLFKDRNKILLKNQHIFIDIYLENILIYFNKTKYIYFVLLIFN